LRRGGFSTCGTGRTAVTAGSALVDRFEPAGRFFAAAPRDDGGRDFVTDAARSLALGGETFGIFAGGTLIIGVRAIGVS
jgi:hypothetical protein